MKRGKKKKLILFAERESLLFIFGVIVLSILFFFGKLSFTGFVIYDSQPGVEGVDAYIRASSDSNYGDQSVLKVGKTAAGLEFRSLIYFNLSEVPDTDTIVSAKMQIYESYSSNGNPITVKVYLVNTNWTEGGVTWNNATASALWSGAGGDYGNLIDTQVLSSEGFYNFTITHAVRAWMNGSLENYGLILISDDAGIGDYKDMDSSDTATSSQAPKVIVDHEGNAVPTINSISSDTNATNLRQVGEDVEFSISWEDIEGDSAQAFVCNSTNISSSGCGEKTFCSSSLALTNPIQCSYTVSDSDTRITDYYVVVCDANCSSVSNSSFYMNHAPNVSLVSPSGGELINQSEGNFTIYFNVTDADSDSVNASVYYSETENYAENFIMSLNASACSGLRNYSWDSTGLAGTYYFILIVNDSYVVVNDSSEGVSISSLIDVEAPQIIAQWTESGIYAGKTTSIYANITEENLLSAWVAFNFSSTNVTMSNTSATQYNASFVAPAVGTYSFKVYANDRNFNFNDSMPWQEFSVSKPTASADSLSVPATALPYHTIKVVSSMSANDSLKDVYAFLNVPDGFSFLSGYSQNSYAGNFSTGQTKNVTWFVSTPLEEGSYSLNATYTDDYSDTWNSANSEISVTSAIGGYEVSLAGYPEVETSQSYYVESFFKQNGAYTNPDSISLNIYDAVGNLVAGPVAMTQKSTGIYNYSYTVGASVTEGQWKTLINATKSSVSYYASEFWKVVGGPFDVRDVTVLNSSVDGLEIQVTTENTGGANKDLTLVWNLTRADTGAVLDSGAETFMVEANSERDWTVNPSTTYTGSARIEFLGYYSQTERAGAYKVFTITSAEAGETGETGGDDGGGGGGGGGGGQQEVVQETEGANMTLEDYETPIVLSKAVPKVIYVTLKNLGDEKLTGIKLSFENLEEDYYTVSQSSDSLDKGKSMTFEVSLMIEDFIGEKETAYVITSNEASLTEEVKIIVMKIDDFFAYELEKWGKEIAFLREEKSDFAEDINLCEGFLDDARENIENEGYIDAKENLKKAEDCINKIKEKKKSKLSLDFFENMSEYMVWIITWILIALLIIVLCVVLYFIYRKLSIVNFMREKENTPPVQDFSRKQMIENKIKDIEDKINK